MTLATYTMTSSSGANAFSWRDLMDIDGNGIRVTLAGGAVFKIQETDDGRLRIRVDGKLTVHPVSPNIIEVDHA